MHTLQTPSQELVHTYVRNVYCTHANNMNSPKHVLLIFRISEQPLVLASDCLEGLIVKFGQE